MAVVDMANTIKELFSDYVVMIKMGTFYEVYNDDAKILHYLLKYELRNISGSVSCGFPTCSINKVMYILENKSINYIMLDKSHNYEEEGKVNYKKKNKYMEVLDSANEYIDKVDRIDKIKNYLLKDSSKIEEIEKIIYA